jgi:uncharacterized membrane protein YccC
MRGALKRIAGGVAAGSAAFIVGWYIGMSIYTLEPSFFVIPAGFFRGAFPRVASALSGN